MQGPIYLGGGALPQDGRITSLRHIAERARMCVTRSGHVAEVSANQIDNLAYYRREFIKCFIALGAVYTIGRFGTIVLSNGSKVKFVTSLGTLTREDVC